MYYLTKFVGFIFLGCVFSNCQNEPDTNLANSSWVMESWTCNGETENLFGPNISVTPCTNQDSTCYFYHLSFSEEEYEIIQIDGSGTEIKESGLYYIDGTKIEFYDLQGLMINQVWNQVLRNGTMLYLYGAIDFKPCSSTAKFIIY